MPIILLLTLSLIASAACAHTPLILAQGPQCVATISDEEAAEIGRKIWMNEGGGKILVWWDDTAECSSFGINNYLWFQAGHDVPFQESFPPLIDFLIAKGAPVPGWIRSKPPAPWKSRAELFAEAEAPEHIRQNPPPKWGMSPEQFAQQDNSRMKELKDFLAQTVDLQARFSAQRAVESLPKMLASAPESERAQIENQFYRVACSRGGLYNLVDYVNFKGEGSNPKERYRNPKTGEMEGWGLLQVLRGMKGAAMGPAALSEFADAAENALRHRVGIAPPERQAGDRRWLDGWIKRIQTYRGR